MPRNRPSTAVGTFEAVGILIGLTNVAVPAPVVQALLMDDPTQQTFDVDNVIALVLAKHCLEKLDESKEPKGVEHGLRLDWVQYCPAVQDRSS
jgi:G3E family GTPase